MMIVHWKYKSGDLYTPDKYLLKCGRNILGFVEPRELCYGAFLGRPCDCMKGDGEVIGARTDENGHILCSDDCYMFETLKSAQVALLKHFKAVEQ